MDGKELKEGLLCTDISVICKCGKPVVRDYKIIVTEKAQLIIEGKCEDGCDGGGIINLAKLISDMARARMMLAPLNEASIGIDKNKLN